eukprot:scaffold3616_cov124-Isochrysis_galbana.AAC.6
MYIGDRSVIGDRVIGVYYLSARHGPVPLETRAAANVARKPMSIARPAHIPCRPACGARAQTVAMAGTAENI